MKVKVLNNDGKALREHLDGKKRIMTYGAGAWAEDIKKRLEADGYKLDCAIVDDAYVGQGFADFQGGGYGNPGYFRERACPAE